MIEQGTEDWHALRLGKVTASRIADVMARTKSGYGASRASYMADLLVERLNGQPTEGFTNAAMQWGTDQEPHARAEYEFITLNDVAQVAFIDHPGIPMTGASPDGLIGEDGLIEIKCPNTKTHIEYLETGKIADQYIKQMHWQMICTGRSWCDFVSYDPRVTVPEMRLKIQHVDLDSGLAEEITEEVQKFLAELADREENLRAKYLKEAA